MSSSNYSNRLSGISRLLNIVIIVLLLLYFGRPLLVPMSFGLLIAIICYPSSKWLESKGWGRGLSATILVVAVVALFVGLLWLLGFELSLLAGNKPEIAAKLNDYVLAIRSWLDKSVGLQLAVQDDILNTFSGNFEQSLGSSLGGVLSATTSTLVSLILVPIFATLFLLHRSTFIRFFEIIAGEKYKQGIREILHESIVTYFRFVKGTFFVYCIVGCLNSVGLLLLGIEHAILFGMIAAFMTIIPYVGILISAALPVAIALITKDSAWYAVGVVLVFSVVQYLEANVIFPRIVGQQLNLSTWAVLVTIIAGTVLWGIAGMILFVPFTGILKIVSDHVPELKALNVLLSRNGTGKNKS